MVHAANSILNILKFLRYVANKNDQMMKAMIHLPNNALNAMYQMLNSPTTSTCLSIVLLCSNW